MAASGAGGTAPLTVWELATLFLDDSKKQFTRPHGRVLGELDKLEVALRPLIDLYGRSSAEELRRTPSENDLGAGVRTAIASQQ